MKSQEEIVLQALEREHVRLVGIVDQAKKECDEVLSAGSKCVEIHNLKFATYTSGLSYGEQQKKLAHLNKEEQRLKRLMEKGLVELVARQAEAAWEAGALFEEIERRRFRIQMQRKTG